MASHIVFILLISLNIVFADEQDYRKKGFMDNLSNGMKFAQNFLGSESVALKVAEFVVKAFQTAHSPTSVRKRPPNNEGYVEQNNYNSDKYTQEAESEINEVPSPMTPLKHLVKLFGLQPNQISAVAVNALVFVAQMISTFLSGPPRRTLPYRSDDPLTWVLNKNSPQLQELISAAKNESLPDSIERMIKDQGTEEETSCIRLLVCKITPFVNRMQKAVFGKEDQQKNTEIKGAATMYRHLPSAAEINARSDICERQHRDCNLNE